MRRFLAFVSFFIIPSTCFSQTLPSAPGSATPTATAPATPLTLPQLLDLAHRANPTLLSAALQEYPDKRVVLLIDDPHVPKTRQARGSQLRQFRK